MRNIRYKEITYFFRKQFKFNRLLLASDNSLMRLTHTLGASQNYWRRWLLLYDIAKYTLQLDNIVLIDVSGRGESINAYVAPTTRHVRKSNGKQTWSVKVWWRRIHVLQYSEKIAWENGRNHNRFRFEKINILRRYIISYTHNNPFY